MAISLNNLNKLKGLGIGGNTNENNNDSQLAPATTQINIPKLEPKSTANAENSAISIPAIPAIPTVSSYNPEPQSTNTNNDTSTNNSLDPEIASRLEELSYQLNQALPDIRTHLLFIHKAILKDPAQVTLLTPAQKAIYFQSLSKQTRVELTAKAASSSKSSKKTANLDIDGFM